MRSERSRAGRTRFAPEVRSQVRWWASSVALAVTGLIGGLLSLVAGEPIAVVLGLLVIAVVASTGRLRARDEFRRGWRQGYETAVRVLLESQAGRTSDVEVRAAVNGDPTPEPWHEHIPPLRPRSRT